jgi:hypothetical protein
MFLFYEIYFILHERLLYDIHNDIGVCHNYYDTKIPRVHEKESLQGRK